MRPSTLDAREEHQGAAIVQPSFDEDGRRSSPPSKERGHTRDLSAHFEEATTLSADPTMPKDTGVGQKHRRGMSGGVSNPAVSHRRIDSIGTSAAIKRGGPHRRIDSAGMDVLAAAADFSREELQAAAAGGRGVTWDTGIRRSPIEVASYDHGKVGHHQQRQHSGGPPTSAYYGMPSAHHGAYPPTYYSHHHAGHGFSRLHPAPSERYPVQYARGREAYSKQHAGPLQQPVLEAPQGEEAARGSSPTVNSINHASSLPKDPADVARAVSSNEGMDPPAPPAWRGGSTQGVQTYVTAIGVGNTTRTMEANTQAVRTASGPLEMSVGHHRKLSSLSNLGLLFSAEVPGDHPLKRGGAHHRATSSTVSFLNQLDMMDMNNPDAAFLRNLQATTGAPPAALNSDTLKAEAVPVPSSAVAAQEKPDLSSKLAAGGASKRVRRKCTMENCQNRVVQGGLCIAHGAKRKQCKHPGCTKHVKKAGLCSTHGPARKKCDQEGCGKVAVQGGRCIAHGAKKRTCSIGDCTKQAILSGMCKKHHDQTQKGSAGLIPLPSSTSVQCQVISTKKTARVQSPKTSGGSTASKKPTHARGLSIFQEISADTVGDLLSSAPSATVGSAPAAASSAAAVHPSHRHRSTFSRDFGTLY
ncbi:MAG: hypothetical protein SGILL_000666 [Bacillariaceae sp.]